MAMAVVLARLNGRWEDFARKRGNANTRASRGAMANADRAGFMNQTDYDRYVLMMRLE